jgi:putative hydrolase of the HAD superfamily
MVMFDIDGTLVDHDQALRIGAVGWLTEQRLVSPGQDLDALIGLWDEVAEHHFPAYHAREITFQEQRRRRLREYLPQVGVAADGLTDEQLDAIFEQYLRHYEAAWSAYDDVLPCLLALPNIRVVVLSNGDQSQQEDKLRRTGLATHFEAVLTSGALGAAKPQPEAYLLACERLGVDPDTVAYVGDRLDIDAQAATAAGLHGVWLDRDASPGAAYDPTITSLRQLPAVLDRHKCRYRSD